MMQFNYTQQANNSDSNNKNKRKQHAAEQCFNKYTLKTINSTNNANITNGNTFTVMLVTASKSILTTTTATAKGF